VNPGEIKRVFVEFFGDPSDDKECYKRYTSTEPFAPLGFDAEVIEFVNVKEHRAQAKEIFRLERVIAKELTENDELGCEYTYVNALKRENKKLAETVRLVDETCDIFMNVPDKIDPFILKRELLKKREELERDGL
jgi:hypothetical protein